MPRSLRTQCMRSHLPHSTLVLVFPRSWVPCLLCILCPLPGVSCLLMPTPQPLLLTCDQRNTSGD